MVTVEKKGLLTKILAVAGTVLAWIPFLAPVMSSIVNLARRAMFRINYSLPVELYWAALAGGGLLLWAALRARSRWRIIALGLGAAVAMLVAGQALVVTAYVVYCLGLVCVGVGGILLLRDLFKPRQRIIEGGSANAE